MGGTADNLVAELPNHYEGEAHSSEGCIVNMPKVCVWAIQGYQGTKQAYPTAV